MVYLVFVHPCEPFECAGIDRESGLEIVEPKRILEGAGLGDDRLLPEDLVAIG
jgi:hypothetical protein